MRRVEVVEYIYVYALVVTTASNRGTIAQKKARPSEQLDLSVQYNVVKHPLRNISEPLRERRLILLLHFFQRKWFPQFVKFLDLVRIPGEILVQSGVEVGIAYAIFDGNFARLLPVTNDGDVFEGLSRTRYVQPANDVIE
jgi:hypothetical protein